MSGGGDTFSFCWKCRKDSDFRCFLCGQYTCESCEPKGPPYCLSSCMKTSFESSWERVGYSLCSEKCIRRLIEYEKTKPARMLEDIEFGSAELESIIGDLDAALQKGPWRCEPFDHHTKRLNGLSCEDITKAFRIWHNDYTISYLGDGRHCVPDAFEMIYVALHDGRFLSVLDAKEITKESVVGEETRKALEDEGFFSI